MKFISVREAKAKLEIIRDTKKEDIIITSWGKPKALLQKLGEEDLEDYIISHSRKIRESIEEFWQVYKRKLLFLLIFKNFLKAISITFCVKA